MEERDLAFVLEIERLSFSHPWPESSFKGEIENHQISFPFVIVYRPLDRVIGYIIFWYLSEEAQISNFAVHPQYRRMKVGEKILKDILKLLKKMGVKDVILEVRPSNFAARSLYSRYGFKPLGVRPAYYQNPVEDALVMMKVFGGEEGK